MISPGKIALIALGLLTLALLLTSCQTMGEIGKVLIPVAHSCAVKIDPRPSFPDTPAAIHDPSKNIEARVNLLLAGRLLRDERIDKLEAAISGCL